MSPPANACLTNQTSGTCSKNAECASGSCADGVCCNEVCDGPCAACKVGSNDPQAGICRAVTGAPQIGHPSCPGVAECPGVCDGFVRDTCAFPGGEKACGDGLCDAGKVTGSRCNSQGACVSGQPKSCFPYVACADGASCLTSCANDGQCDAAYFCDKETKKCQADRDLGEICAKASECASGNCADGVCCDAACTGQCEACSAQGQCKPTLAGQQPAGDRQKCDTSADSGCHGSCDGGDPTSCKFPGATTLCAATACKGDVFSPVVCDGAGECKVQPTTDCAPFACDSATMACATHCTNDKDCSTGAVCGANGQCTLGEATCADKNTAKAPDGTLKKCDPYTCLNGQCRDVCASDLECVGSFRCDAQVCVPKGGLAAAQAQAGAQAAAGTRGRVWAERTPALEPAGRPRDQAGLRATRAELGAGVVSPVSATAAAARMERVAAAPRGPSSIPAAAWSLLALAAAASRRRRLDGARRSAG
jgi:hypothetical protein